MTIGAVKRGDLFLLKAFDGVATFNTVAALRTTSLAINGQMIDITNKDSAKRRTLLEGGGIVSLTITAEGVFTEHAEQDRLEDRALAGSLNDHQIVFDDGRTYEASFQVTNVQYAGNHDGEETYSVTLESSGDVTVTPGT